MSYNVKSYNVDKYSIDRYSPNVYKSQLYSIDKYNVLTYSVENRQIIKTNDSCDKYDYLIAIACGVIGGLIDIFLVGSPGNSKLGNWTDKQVDKTVTNFAKKLGWKPSHGKSDDANSAIGFLERKFKVNYDQRRPSDVNNKFLISPKTHRMMSLGHSPDIIGLFFSILNQFTNTSSFIAEGKLITIDTEHFELYGSNFITKLLCGVSNWIGHIMSDIAGCSKSHFRGTGIVIPFFEMFGLCKFGKFSTKDGIKDLAELAQTAYNQGYDSRFGLTMAIPVVITNIIIRLMWSIRQYVQYKKPLKECIPLKNKHANLRVMLIFGYGTLCILDLIDAAIESGGDILTFFLHINLIAWFKLLALIFKEICIRLKISLKEQIETPAYTKITSEINDNFVTDLNNLDFSAQKSKIISKIIKSGAI